jgi:NADP-dependent 3-hydroxy acid dehydrogenase YdfG
MSQFAGKVTVVTSAGSGIGRAALAVALAAEGCLVWRFPAQRPHPRLIRRPWHPWSSSHRW